MIHSWPIASLLAVALLLASSIEQPAQAEPARTALKKSPTPVCDRENFRLIIDVGHSAEVPGALSARGIGEYTYNLNLAQAIEKKMREAGFAKTHLLITPGKAMAGLISRVHYASNSPGDLLLSIHHDSVPDKFLQKWTFDGKERPYCDRFTGHSIFVSGETGEYKTSLAFARQVGLQLKGRGLQYTPHYTEKFMGARQRQLVDSDAGVYRFDNLAVLRFTNMPAVLLEAGSIINRDEELLMASTERQKLIAEAVTTAVENFCKAHGNRKHEPQIRRATNAAAATPTAPAFPFPFAFTQQ